MIRLLIVEDHSSFRSALAFMLDREEDINVVAEAGTIDEARTILTSTPVDVALVDMELPDGSGLDLIRDTRSRNPEAEMILLTGSARPQTRALAVAAGACGVLHKSTTITTIVGAVQKVAAGQSLITPSEAVSLLQEAARFNGRTREVEQALKGLTPREVDVLRGLAAGLDNAAVADRLHISTETVRSHVVRLLRKLDAESRLQAVLIAVRHGYLDLDELA